MDKDQTKASKIEASEAEMAFGETLRQKVRAGRPRLEDLWDRGGREAEPRPNETGEGEDES